MTFLNKYIDHATFMEKKTRKKKPGSDWIVMKKFGVLPYVGKPRCCCYVCPPKRRSRLPTLDDGRPPVQPAKIPQIGLVQTCSNWFKMDPIGFNLFKLDQTC